MKKILVFLMVLVMTMTMLLPGCEPKPTMSVLPTPKTIVYWGDNRTAGGIPIIGADGTISSDPDNLSMSGDTLTATNISAPTGRTATYVIAASDSPAYVKAQADYVMPSSTSDLGIVITAAIALGYLDIYLGQGNFTMSTAVEMVNYLNIKGSGMKTTYIALSDNANCNMFQYTGSSYIYFVQFSDLEMYGNYTNNSSGSGIDANVKAADGIITNCFFDFFKEEGVYIGYSWNWRITNCIFEHCQKYAMDGGNEIVGTKFIYNVQGPIRGQRYTSCYFFQNDQWGLTAPLQVTNCKFEDNSKPADNYGDILITSGTTPVISNNIFVGGVHSTYGVYLNTGATAIVTNNQFSGHIWAEIYKHPSIGYCEISNNKGYVNRGEIRTYSGTITGGAQNAILFSWHNPNAQDIWINKVVVNLSAADGDAPNVDIGIADDATYTNGGTEFFNDLTGETTGIHDSFVAGDGGTQTKWVLCQDSASATDGWITAKILDADGTSLAGSYYIEVVGQ